MNGLDRSWEDVIAANTLFTPTGPKPTSHRDAWKGGHFESYRLNFSIRAARLHEAGKSCLGHWYAIDEYNLSIGTYLDRFAWNRSADALDIYLLVCGTIVNVGHAAKLNHLRGGGLQVEVVNGPPPLLLEHISRPKSVRW